MTVVGSPPNLLHFNVLLFFDIVSVDTLYRLWSVSYLTEALSRVGVVLAFPLVVVHDPLILRGPPTPANCPRGCSGNGKCHADNTCECDLEWTG